MKSFQTQTHYEVLEISVGATSADVKSAYERLSNLYSDDQVVLYGLIDASMASALRARLKEAFEVLSDEDRRDGYDAKIGLPPRGPPKVKTVAAPVKPPVSAPTWGNYTFVSSASAPPPATSSAYTYVVPAPSYAAPTAPMAPVVKRAPAPETVRPPPAEVVVAKEQGAAEVVAPEVSAVSPLSSVVTPQASAATPQSSAATPQPSAATPQPSAATPQSSAATPQASAATPQPSAATPQPSAATPQPSAVAPQPEIVASRPDGSAPPALLELVAHADAPTLEAVVETDLLVVISAPPASVPRPVVAEPLPLPVDVAPVPASPGLVVAEPAPPASAPKPVVAEVPVVAPVPPAVVAEAQTEVVPAPLASAPNPVVVDAPAAVALPSPTKPVAAEALVEVVPSAPRPVEVATPPPPASAPKPEPRVDITPTFAPIADDSAIVTVRSTVSREFRAEPRPRPYEIPEGVEINGDLLRQVRLARGLTLAQLADRTRIGSKHLENVEGDRYDALPVGVYLRGILMNLARELGLDGLRVARSYLTFVDAHRSKG